MPIPCSTGRRFAGAMLLVCTGILLAAQAPAQSGAGGFRIAGKVVSSTSSTPLPQTRVTIASVSNQREKQSLITGNDGAFEFKNLAPGKYSLQAARRGFIESSFDQHERYSTAIVTGSDADSEHLVFRMVPQAVLTGRVLDEAGEPVRQASVSLFRQDQSAGVTLVRRVEQDQTDDRGTYEFAELPAGNYFLSVNARPWYALHPRSVPNPDGTLDSPPTAHSFDVTYATTYYPDATDSDEATPIPLRGGERLSVDIHLSPVPALRILVRTPQSPEQGFAAPAILQKSFDSMENVTSQFMARGPNVTFSSGPGSTATPGLGQMELTGIPPGKYTVFVPDNNAEPMQGTLAEIDLNHNGQELSPSSGEPVSSIKFAVQISGEPRLPQQLRLALQNGEHKVVVATAVDAKGDAEFVHIPRGKYNVLAATPTKNYAVTRITSNGLQTSGHGLDIEPGSTIEGTITLVGGTGSVEGFAKRKDKGIPGAMIVLVPKDPEANGDLFRRDQSDLDGSFSLASVIPGEYTIVAIENGWDLNWSQPGVISHYLPQGRKLAVTAGAQGAVHLSEPVEVQPK